VADSPGNQALPLVREWYGLRRFGCRLDILAAPDVRAALGRYPAFTARYWTHEALPGTALDGVTALAAAPSRDLLARMALGLRDTAAADACIRALCLGIPVFMDTERAEQADGGGRSAYFGALYARRAAAVREMGVRPVPQGRYLTTLAEALGLARQADGPGLPDSPGWALPPGPGPGTGPGGNRASGAPVITERDVLAHGGKGGEWMLPRDAVITPSARDAAGARGLVLRKAAAADG
jgi:hypothetical protein